METGSSSLVFFYGLFWAFVINSASRYRLFETAHIFSRQYWHYALKRFVVGLIILNLLPVLWLWFLYRKVVPSGESIIPILSAALASLSVFGIHRILHAMVASNCMLQYFYPANEHEELVQKWRKYKVNSFWAHCIPGIIYMLLFWILAKLVTHA